MEMGVPYWEPRALRENLLLQKETIAAPQERLPTPKVGILMAKLGVSPKDMHLMPRVWGL
ncbi:MAG: hypothetical protein HFJ86_12645 [Oscillospiraceae bacterium]|nr:hypothetical protein [Oscillospiraceae bacterium]